ncbi:MAG: membrane protein insertase YidC [Candidatus Polarisedimenticolia bacterium]
MEKRALIAIVLSVAVISLWQYLFVPATVPPASPAQTQGPAQTGPPEQAARPAAGLPAEAAPGSPAGSALPAAPVQAAGKEEFRVTTPDQDIRFSNEGGRITWWRLPRYTGDKGVAVNLIPEQAHLAGVLPLQIQVPEDEAATKKLATALHTHTVEDIPEGDPSGLGPGKRVTFEWADGEGLAVRKTLEIPETGYEGHASFAVTRGGVPVRASLIFASGLSQPVEDKTSSYGHVEGQGVVHDAHSVIRFMPAKVAERRVYSPSHGVHVMWAGLESTYFIALALGPQPPDPNAPALVSDLAVAFTPHQAPPAPGQEPAPLLTAGLETSGLGEYRLFVGPKDYKLLTGMNQELVQAIHFSDYSIIYFCTRVLFDALSWINSWVGNYGWSIIILTFFVRLIFFPISYKSMITMRQTSKKMLKVQPKVKSIQERYKKMKRSMETQQQMNQEIMALYKKEGVNPMSNLGGCLPLLLQMPVFIGFYNLLAVTIELRQAPFIWWLHDLSRRDPYYITPILMGASWLLQQAMTSSSIPDPVQRRMMMLMPAMFTLFMLNMPSGLVLYWLTNNVLGMAQQYLINKKADQIDTAHGRREATSQGRRAEDGQTA